MRLNMAARMGLYGVFGGLALGLSGCVATTGGTDGDAALASLPAGDFRQVEDLMLVDCLLPGQVRQLGRQMTYLSPRRRVKTTKSDCGIRGGEFILFDRSDYRTALQSLLPKARAGDPVAQTYVGEIYEKGLGLPGPDYSRAAEWYKKAADAGHRPAQTHLGSLYERGLGVSKNRAQALTLYRRATGLDEDGLVFESQLRQERAALQREIQVRNQVAASLRTQLASARATGGSRPTAAGGATELQRVQTSLQREAQSEQELVRRQLHAVNEIKAAEAQQPAGKSAQKAAQIGKLELSLRERSNAIAATEQRLSMVP